MIILTGMPMSLRSASVIGDSLAQTARFGFALKEMTHLLQVWGCILMLYIL